jgi:hypothetical protein
MTKTYRLLHQTQENQLDARLDPLLEDLLALLPDSSVLARRAFRANLKHLQTVPRAPDDRLRRVLNSLVPNDLAQRAEGGEVEGVGGERKETVDKDELR